jgi:hypothetical protein
MGDCGRCLANRPGEALPTFHRGVAICENEASDTHLPWRSFRFCDMVWRITRLLRCGKDFNRLACQLGEAPSAFESGIVDRTHSLVTCVGRRMAITALALFEVILECRCLFLPHPLEEVVWCLLTYIFIIKVPSSNTASPP